MRKKILCLLLLSFSSYSYGNSELDRTVQAQGQLLTQYQQQIIELQTEVDQLRGQVEEINYQLNQTIERQKMILLQQSGSPMSLNNNQTQSTQTNATTLVNWTPTGNDKTDYNFIIKFVLDGKQSKESIAAFQQFLKDYPKSTYRANVNYWLGQLYYEQRKSDDASFYYATVVKDYPKSPKASDSLYKIGLILLDKGDKAKAKAVFSQVISQYPQDKKTIEQANKQLAQL